jgi:hypothetical protein
MCKNVGKEKGDLKGKKDILGRGKRRWNITPIKMTEV